jgi:ABC-type lipoprotein export system ATPase subunit
MSSPQGSIWRKWDLHVHTPNTKLSDNFKSANGTDLWDKYCESIETSEVDVFGITDYFSTENYFNFTEKFKTKYPSSKKIFFPNIELRLEVSVNKKAEEINLHIIFNNKTEKAKIESFLAKLNTNISKNGASVSCKDISTQSEYKSAAIDYKILRKTLKDVFGKDDCYLIFAAANNSGLRPDNNSPRKLNITDEIDRMCDGFFGGQQNIEYCLKTDRYEEGVAKKKPVIGGCDAHSFDDLENWLGKRVVKTVEQTEVVEKDITWIKAETTFEGLKQIIYEPETRIFIGEEQPKKPINTIDSITVKIPTDAKVGEDKFCFAGNDSSYNLSPYFNCFIGGRGSGKSTVLNFLGLHSNNHDSPEYFWNNLNPSFDPNGSDIFSFSGTEIFEFLAQSEIETFARDKAKFTQAIYDRANGPSKILQTFEDSIYKYQTDLDKITEAVSDLQELVLQKKNKEKEKRSLENTKNIIESEDYKKLTNSISDLTQKIQVHKKWSNEVYLLKTQLSDTIELYSKVLEGNNDQIKYKESFLLAINKAKEAIKILEDKNFDEVKKEEKSHQDNLLLLEDELKKLLSKGNFSEDNIEQIKSAPQKIVALEREIEKIGFQIEGKNKIIATFNDIVIKLKADKENYEQKIQTIVNPLQKLLEKQFEENQGKDIKKISLEYSFDEKSAWIALTEEFYDQFHSKYHDSERGKEVCEFIIKNKKTFAVNTFDGIAKLVQQSQKGDTQYIKFFDEVFKDDKNFQIFQAIRDKHLYDVKANKIIQVKYDNKDVHQASFGQRCTAVVVIMLLFGNYPLIIDEPEAHLDSSLIANYLVPLLKEKKSDRQIIFATHNANFVINGDAEKIFILKNESGQTEVIETTIEDIENREELLKLEGGKEAFEKRGEKLNII